MLQFFGQSTAYFGPGGLGCQLGLERHGVFGAEPLTGGLVHEEEEYAICRPGPTQEYDHHRGWPRQVVAGVPKANRDNEPSRAPAFLGPDAARKGVQLHGPLRMGGAIITVRVRVIFGWRHGPRAIVAILVDSFVAAVAQYDAIVDRTQPRMRGIRGVAALVGHDVVRMFLNIGQALEAVSTFAVLAKPSLALDGGRKAKRAGHFAPLGRQRTAKKANRRDGSRIAIPMRASRPLVASTGLDCQLRFMLSGIRRWSGSGGGAVSVPANAVANRGHHRRPASLQSH